MGGLAIIKALMKLLAFDTSTERLHLGACDGPHTLTHQEAGGAQSSARIVPLAMATLNGLGLGLQQLDAIVMGRGPGSFTGLRTACAVAQGLAFGAGRPVLPIDTLWAVAEQARQGQAQIRVLAVVDARMGQYYSAAWQFSAGRWQASAMNALLNPDEVVLPRAWLDEAQDVILAGTGLTALWPMLKHTPNLTPQESAPTAAALLRLAPQAWADGLAVPAELAMPLYVRDKVAQTTAERTAQAQA